MTKNKGLLSEDLNGFLDEGTELRGELRFRDTFRIDGKVKGRIVSDKTLIVGEAGVVEADIECGFVSIRGTVKGQVLGREKIEVLSGAHVVGSLSSPRLVIEEGAFFEGECEMAGARQHRAALPAAPAVVGTEKG
jgi:cytoskeletal protein CcmA (bactofilin family)